ncbi:MAG: hypothetical protein IIB46_09050 [Nitrospinae bacterium]|nr:hypothetical protein [Nitrospinota bacterium]
MVLTRWNPLYEIRRARRLANRRWAGFPKFAAGTFPDIKRLFGKTLESTGFEDTFHFFCVI